MPAVQKATPTNSRESATPAVVAKNLEKRYVTSGEVVHAVRGISLSVNRGELVVVMGASGSGKSTLLHLLGGLDHPDGGSIAIDGHPLERMSDSQRTLFRRRRIGFVFQAYNLLPTMTALENVTVPALLDGNGDKKTQQRAMDLLRLLDLDQRHNHRPQALSGGEQQRVAIARALMQDPAVILADEPTGNLDSKHGQDVWRILADLVRSEQRAVVAVTHEAEGAAMADRVIVLKDGKIAGEIHPEGDDHVALVANRYRELVD